MRLCQLAYFDLGVSYGLDDTTFRSTPQGATRVPDIMAIGISNPLGEGMTTALGADVLNLWRVEAVRRVQHPDMELGHDPSTGDVETFKNELVEKIRAHPVGARVTIFAIGTALVELELAPGIEPRFLMGFDKCYEFGAYARAVSEAVHAAAVHLAEQATGAGGEKLQRLTQRAPAEIQTDDHGWEESRLLNAQGFSRSSSASTPATTPRPSNKPCSRPAGGAPRASNRCCGSTTTATCTSPGPGACSSREHRIRTRRAPGGKSAGC
jgi:hypothetical protein